ncbi:zinc-finger homeodomain protein 2-like [Phragmites australis]|uniref:zinc-finger homeodomain protein 2-like n=1 Tax=Phragmites australis TaxID=29695 RepID=UPI002D78A641|nr:zinc-finger homeodomain protein 2-like [Phragmites australis]
MDFDEHDDGDGDEEMPPIPVSSSYEPQLPPRLGLGDSGSGGFRTPGGGGGGGGAGGGTRYRECLKNHAVGIGGHAVDGCGEFMAAGEEGSIDALRCAACGCHRNFHRKESDSPTGAASAEPAALSPAAITAYGAAPHHQFSPYYRTPAGYLLYQHQQMAAAAGHLQRPLALPSTSHSGRDEGDDMSGMIGPMVVAPMVGMSLGSGGPSGSGSGSGKKRFRTKFTQEQKDMMLAFAERLGWRIQKHDEAAVQQFCEEVRVKRHVLKVWMHNNKHTLGKKP